MSTLSTVISHMNPRTCHTLTGTGCNSLKWYAAFTLIPVKTLSNRQSNGLIVSSIAFTWDVGTGLLNLGCLFIYPVSKPGATH